VLAKVEKEGEGDKPGKDEGKRQIEFCPQKDTSHPGTTKIDK